MGRTKVDEDGLAAQKHPAPSDYKDQINELDV